MLLDIQYPGECRIRFHPVHIYSAQNDGSEFQNNSVTDKTCQGLQRMWVLPNTDRRVSLDVDVTEHRGHLSLAW